jgi:hypothetical protein
MALRTGGATRELTEMMFTSLALAMLSTESSFDPTVFAHRILGALSNPSFFVDRGWTNLTEMTSRDGKVTEYYELHDSRNQKWEMSSHLGNDSVIINNITSTARFSHINRRTVPLIKTQEQAEAYAITLVNKLRPIVELGVKRVRFTPQENEPQYVRGKAEYLFYYRYKGLNVIKNISARVEIDPGDKDLLSAIVHDNTILGETNPGEPITPEQAKYIALSNPRCPFTVDDIPTPEYGWFLEPGKHYVRLVYVFGTASQVWIDAVTGECIKVSL